jgi:hypothetical protein
LKRATALTGRRRARRRARQHGFADLYGNPPRVLAHYLEIMGRRHRPLGSSRDARCSCGTPYTTCEAARRLSRLRAADQAAATIRANQWFG